ncbi:MAG: PatB family C-S lyase [Absicoccus sp.]|uniref:MalY/PatB family protein n=1 Tax=Absicoccus sp. TaxID=2718527 RepID=UPI002A7642B8|nr:PatB family C-S lyase [Absicoccus sp.]MDY3034764.1 PatB family C-S lyase [Absicoccus sp.]
MIYDFDKIIDRKYTDSIKWDLKNAKAPMWVADMDFQVAPAIQQAISNRLYPQVYGYTLIPPAFYTSIQKWWLERHGIQFEREMMQYVTGVLPALNVMIQRFTQPGDHIVIMTPGYHMFRHIIENMGRVCIENPLLYVNGSYIIDFNELDHQLGNAKTSMMIVCNPHNPTGNLWDRLDLEHIGNVCQKHHVLVVSDEIHCDIVQPGYSYVPYAKASEICWNNSITLVSCTKAFNVAGLSSACVIIPNPALCKQAKIALEQALITSNGFFNAQVSIAAFGNSGDWLDAMNAYVAENKKIVTEFIRESITELRVVESLSTYLMWIDCSQMVEKTDGICKLLLEKEGLYVSKGSDFGKNGQAFFRMNVALPRQQLLENLLSLRSGLHTRTMRRYIEEYER